MIEIKNEHYGVEPTIPTDHILSDAERVSYFNYYQYSCETPDVRHFYSELLQSLERPADLALLRKVPDAWLDRTGAFLARMMMRGAQLPDDSIQFLNDRLELTLSHAGVDELAEKPKGDKPDIQSRIREKNNAFIAEVEGALDDCTNLEKFSLYDLLKASAATPMMASAVAKHFTPITKELIDAFDTDDEQLKEGYRNYSEKSLAKMVLFYQSIVDDATRYADTTKKLRAPRKKKAKSVEKILRTFKYSKSFPELRLASIDPVKVLEAQELWTYNWKTKTLSVMKAIDRGGLMIKGTTIVNHSSQNSFAKTIGRKTQETLDEVLTGGKVALRKIMEGAKAIKSTRINDSTVLLRVI